MKKLILIDAHAIIHRAYHALPPLSSPLGEPTNAVYGFTNILLRILRELKPDYIAAAFDLPGPTFRHVAYERYKAQRPETPSDLSSQFSKVREVLEAFNILVFEKEGYEADDIIGTAVKKFSKEKNLETIIVTGDMDALQLVGPRVKVYSMKKGISETTIYDTKAVEERYGFGPSAVCDFKGLKGDPSDNIPGVKGIGEKTATDLIKTFGSIENIYKALKKNDKRIKLSVAEKLRVGEEEAKFSKELATINKDAPTDFNLKTLVYKGGNENKTRMLFERLGFASLLKRLPEEKPSVMQASLGIVSETTAKIKELKDENDFLEFERGCRGEIGLIIHEGELYLILEDGRAALCKEKVFSLKATRKFFEKSKFSVQDGKFITHFLRYRGIELGKIEFDLSIAAYLSGSFLKDFSFLAIVSRELGRMVSQNPREEFKQFFEIKKSLDAKLGDGNLRKILEEMELPLIKTLADMEDRGILVDKKYLEKLSGETKVRIDSLTKDIYKIAGTEFNINSPQQLSVILFEKLGVATRGLRKTEKEGRISTGAAELEKLKNAHPIVEKILEYRELAKLKSTYIDALPQLISKDTERIHTTFNQAGAATGRLSSSNPNLQNIPIMSELGREVRKAFVAESGFLLVSFDYSQIELRVAAHISGDKKMIEAFRNGMDIHKITASEIYNVPLEKVTPDLRRAAKTLNFGILYGMGSGALSESTDMSREDARKFIEEYFRDFSGIRDYIENTKCFVEENGYVETIFGRRRYIPEIHSPNWQLKREAERMAVNMPIQGSATGDIIKMAMIKVDEWIKNGGRTSTERGSTSESLPIEDVRLLLQVHDELLFEIRKGLIKKFAPKIKEIMENVAELKVPLVVDVKAGENWGEQEII